MQFIFNKGWYQVARITGSQDNILAVRLSDTPCPVRVTSFPMKDKNTARIGGDEVLRQVEEGLSVVNRELGQQYGLSEIRFLPSDFSYPSVYSLLIYRLIMRIHRGRVLSKFSAILKYRCFTIAHSSTIL